MATSKRSMATLVAASVWLATLGSAAAFTLRLNPRVHPQHRGVSEGAATCSSSVTAARPGAEPGVATQRVLYLPSFIIAAPWPQGAAPVAARAPVGDARDRPEMDRAKPGDFEVGPGGVRVDE
jgi:hypothetical protein